MKHTRRVCTLLFAVIAVLALAAGPAAAQQTKPNILIIWGDDIGVHNISAYNQGVTQRTTRPFAW